MLKFSYTINNNNVVKGPLSGYKLKGRLSHYIVLVTINEIVQYKLNMYGHLYIVPLNHSHNIYVRIYIVDPILGLKQQILQ